MYMSANQPLLHVLHSLSGGACRPVTSACTLTGWNCHVRKRSCSKPLGPALAPCAVGMAGRVWFGFMLTLIPRRCTELRIPYGAPEEDQLNDLEMAMAASHHLSQVRVAALPNPSTLETRTCATCQLRNMYGCGACIQAMPFAAALQGLHNSCPMRSTILALPALPAKRAACTRTAGRPARTHAAAVRLCASRCSCMHAAIGAGAGTPLPPPPPRAEHLLHGCHGGCSEWR